MARMLGRFRDFYYSCGRGFCKHGYCRDGLETRRFKRREQHTVRVVIEEYARPPAFLDSYDLAAIGMYEEYEQAEGECRHGCNGSHVISGYADEVCDWQCHPGLEADPARAARHAELMG